jgi:hypothetical protein
MFDEGGAMAEQTVQRAHLGIRAKRAAQQAQAVELLNPLARYAQHVALAPGHMLEMPAIDEKDVEATCFEDLQDRNPVHPRGLQRDGVHAAGAQPIGPGV